jgi:Flp pilus assembly pilin Flp
MRDRFEAKFDALESRIDAIDFKFDTKIDTMGAKFDTKFDNICEKIDRRNKWFISFVIAAIISLAVIVVSCVWAIFIKG